jgi:transcriptional regulator
MNIKKELTKGSSALLVLSVLENEEMYGYQIIKEIEKRSEDVFSFKEGTLYPILHAFEEQEYLMPYWKQSEQGRQRKYYRITDKGRKLLVKSREEWESYSDAVNKVIKPQTAPVTA